MKQKISQNNTEHKKSVADLNIHVRQGRIYGLLGRNGAGKTTTMKMLLGLTQPTSGEVAIWGKPLRTNEKKLFSQYSLGMKQRLAIALAIMHDPELLILDEPINGLDPIGIAEVRSFIHDLCTERGKTILISSHILPEIALLADDIGIIDHGALLEEESLAELETKSSRHIRFTVSSTTQAARILR